MRHIFFLILMVSILSGCATPKPHSVRMIIGGNVQGKITRMEEGVGNIYGTLARVGGLIERRKEEDKLPTVMFQVGNTVLIEDESTNLKAKLMTEGSKMIGFVANLQSSLEFKDSPEAARQRDSWEWPQVLSNVKPKAGIDPPVKYKAYHRSEPRKGWFVYLINFVDSRSFKDSDLLSLNYDYLAPNEFMAPFVRKVRTTDMIVAHFQAASTTDVLTFLNTQEAHRIDLLILPAPVYQVIQQENKKEEILRDVNIIAEPVNVSNIQEAILTWDNLKEKWNLEQHQLQASLNYPEKENVKKLLEASEKDLRDSIRKQSFKERVESFLPKEGASRSRYPSEKCARCHPSAYDAWKKTQHAKIEKQVVCDDCHDAGDPHLIFVQWFATLSPSYQKIVIELYPDHLMGRKPAKDSCSKCHAEGFNFDSEWLKIKHSLDENTLGMIKGKEELQPGVKQEKKEEKKTKK